jgi:WD40 repeat protein
MLTSACSLALLGPSQSSNPPYPAIGSPPGLVRQLSGDVTVVTTVAWSPDSKFVASGGEEPTVRVWDVATGQVTATVTGISGGAAALAWSPDGKLLGTAGIAPASTNDSAQVWDTSTWKPLYKWSANPQPIARLLSLTWSPDGKSIAIAAATQQGSWLDIWDYKAQKSTQELTSQGGIANATWSPNGKLLAFASSIPSTTPLQGAVGVWDISKGGGPSNGNNTILLTNPREAVPNSVAWSPNGNSLAVGYFDNTVKIWDFGTKQNTSTLSGHSGAVNSVAWSPNGEYLASGSDDGTVKVWKVSNGKEVASFKHLDIINSVAWSPDGKLLASACVDRDVYIWDVSAFGTTTGTSSPTP